MLSRDDDCRNEKTEEEADMMHERWWKRTDWSRRRRGNTAVCQSLFFLPTGAPSISRKELVFKNRSRGRVKYAEVVGTPACTGALTPVLSDSVLVLFYSAVSSIRFSPNPLVSIFLLVLVIETISIRSTAITTKNLSQKPKAPADILSLPPNTPNASILLVNL